MQVVCINDENRPKRISPYEWIKEGEIYTVIEITKMGSTSRQDLVINLKKYNYQNNHFHMSTTIQTDLYQSYPYNKYLEKKNQKNW
jgi:hypothetical protein